MTSSRRQAGLSPRVWWCRAHRVPTVSWRRCLFPNQRCRYAWRHQVARICARYHQSWNAEYALLRAAIATKIHRTEFESKLKSSRGDCFDGFMWTSADDTVDGVWVPPVQIDVLCNTCVLFLGETGKHMLKYTNRLSSSKLQERTRLFSWRASRLSRKWVLKRRAMLVPWICYLCHYKHPLQLHGTRIIVCLDILTTS